MTSPLPATVKFGLTRNANKENVLIKVKPRGQSRHMLNARIKFSDTNCYVYRICYLYIDIFCLSCFSLCFIKNATFHLLDGVHNLLTRSRFRFQIQTHFSRSITLNFKYVFINVEVFVFVLLFPVVYRPGVLCFGSCQTEL